MKKTILPALALAALIVASCAKEKDGYDKNLTRDPWNVSSATSVEEEIVKNDYTNGNPNTTNTERTTITIANGQATRIDYELDTQVGSADYYEQQTQVSDLSLSYKFEQDGIFTSDRTEQAKSVTTEYTGSAPVTVTVTTQPVQSSSSGLWSWQNTGDQKSILSFDMGSLQVEKISKSELVLKLNTSSTQINKPNSAQTTTQTSTTKLEITMTR